MREKEPMRIGMVGHRFMGRVHSHAYRNVAHFFDLPVEPVMQGLAGTDLARAERAASELGWKSAESDWRRLIERKDIDVIDICAPNDVHSEIAIAASQTGKAVLCEKPLAMSLVEARRVLDEVRQSGIIHMICFNYRFVPAIQLARRLIAQGKLGRIRHVRAQYLQDWMIDPGEPIVWRLQKVRSGSGALGDIASHIIDLARFLVGDFDEVVGQMNTFVQQRPVDMGEAQKEVGLVDVDDACSFLARFQNGAIGVFEASRFAGGNRNGNRIEINGEKGSLRWDLEHLNTLQLYLDGDDTGLQGFRTIHCTEPDHAYAREYWPSGHCLGYETTFINLVSEFAKGVYGGYSSAPNFLDGYESHAVMHAVEESAKRRCWVKVRQDGMDSTQENEIDGISQ